MEGEAGGFPGGDAAGEFCDGGEAGALEKAGGDRRAVATGTMDEQRAIFGKHGQMIGEMVKGKAQASRDEFLLAFARIADIDDKGWMSGREKIGGELGTEPFGEGDEIGTCFEGLQAVLQEAGHMIKTDAAEAYGGFIFAAGVGDDDDGMSAIDDGAGPGGVLAIKADVDAASEMSSAKFVGVAGVEDLRAFFMKREHFVEWKRGEFALESLVKSRAFLTVEDGIVDEVRRGFGLIGGDEVDEGLLGHGLESVVRAALFANGGDGFLADGLAAEGAGTMGGIDEAGIGEREQFGLEGVVEEGAEVGGGPAESNAKIRAANIADEKRITGEHGVGFRGGTIEIENEERDGLGGMAGSFEGLETNATEFDGGAVAEGSEAILSPGFGAEIDCGTEAIAEFEMTGDEISVEMGEEDMFDLKAVFFSEGEVAIDVALGIDDGGDACGIVGDEVRGVSEAVEIELVEDHGGPPRSEQLTKGPESLP